MASLVYINSKLVDAIYILTTDEGDARTRLARVLPKITILSSSSFPPKLQKISIGSNQQLKGVLDKHHQGFHHLIN